MKRLMVFGLCAAVMMLATGVAGASTVQGAYSLAPASQLLPYSSDDPSNSISGDTLTATLWTRTDNSLSPIYTAGVYVFTFNSPVLFSAVDSVSASYNVLAGNLADGGSPRFVFDFADGATANIPWQLVNGVNTGNISAGFHPTGDVIGTADIGWSYAPAVGLGNGYTNYATVLAALGNDEVTSISIVADGGWMATQGLTVTNFDVDAVPEPISMIFFGTGLVAVGGYVSRRRMLRRA
jgi:hypothetical protein